MSKDDTWSWGPAVVLGLRFTMAAETPGGPTLAVWVTPGHIVAVEDGDGAAPNSWVHLDSGKTFHVLESADSVMKRLGEAYDQLR